MLILRRLDNRLGECLRRLSSNDIVDASDISPSLPSREQSRQRVSETMLECRYHDAASTARHPLHVPQYKRSRYRVRFPSSSASHDDGYIGTDELCQSLRIIEVNFVHNKAILSGGQNGT